jgi:hypothetical protein
MVSAEQGKIVHGGGASVQPVLDVVAVQEAVVGAAGEGAAVVAEGEGAAERGGNGAGAAAGETLGEPLTRRASRADLSPLRGSSLPRKTR